MCVPIFSSLCSSWFCDEKFFFSFLSSSVLFCVVLCCLFVYAIDCIHFVSFISFFGVLMPTDKLLNTECQRFKSTIWTQTWNEMNYAQKNKKKTHKCTKQINLQVINFKRKSHSILIVESFVNDCLIFSLLVLLFLQCPLMPIVNMVPIQIFIFYFVEW